MVPSVVSGLILHIVKTKMAALERREKTKEECMFLVLKTVNAAMALSEACAISVRDGKTNGELKAAQKYAEEAKHAQRDYIQREGIKHIV